MYNEFQNKIVLITGGTSGIGKATALSFANWGAKVIISGRDPEKGLKVISEAEIIGLKLDFIQADTSIPENVKNLISNIIEKYKRLDIAFNNAGVGGDGKMVADCNEKDWAEVINVNLNGVFYCMKYEIIEMLKSGCGSIVNNVSVSGHKGYPKNVAYVASKHGLVGLTKSAAMAYAGKQIRVNGISPGLITTPMTDLDRFDNPNYDEWSKRIEPIGRMGEANEVAEAVLWLCSSKSSFVTGNIMAVDGGILAC